MDNLVSPFDNEFVKTHCTDDLHKKIISELTTRKPGEKTGRKINLTAEMLRVFLYHVSTGKKLKISASLAGIEENTRQKYNQNSETFRRVVSLAEDNANAVAVEAVFKAMAGTKPGFVQLKHPKTNEPIYIQIAAKDPNVQVAQWWLEKNKYFGNEEGDSAAVLGAPQNEREVELQEMLLNRHYDYVRRKQREASSKSNE